MAEEKKGKDKKTKGCKWTKGKRDEWVVKHGGSLVLWVCTGWLMMVQVLFQYVLMQNRKKGQLSISLTKTKPSFLQPNSQRLIERETKGRAGELAPLAHKKRPQDRQQTETDGEWKSQIQYQLIPSSLPKSKLPWEVTLQRERQAKPNLASTIINVIWQTHTYITAFTHLQQLRTDRCL